MVVTATTRRRRSAIVSAATSLSEVAPGDVLGGRYRVERMLGEGGMGRVYCAEHLRLARKVAIKVLARDRATASAEDRFAQEASAMAKIRHPNIVDVLDFGETNDGAPYIVMELLEGEDLRELMARGGPRPWSQVRDVVVQICHALQAAHDHGVVHRDLKPENVFLVRHGEQQAFVKVLDFGIAKLLERTDRSLTVAGGLVGTPEYMSPEQARGVGVDHRADIYSLGMVAYEMLTGDVPFVGDTFTGVLMQQINDDVPPPSRRRPDLELAPEIDAVVMRALAKSREDRYASMREMATTFAATHDRTEVARNEAERAAGRGTVTTTIVTPPLETRRIQVDSLPETWQSAPATVVPGHTLVDEPDLPSERSRVVALLAAAGVVAVVVAGAWVLWPSAETDATSAVGATIDDATAEWVAPAPTPEVVTPTTPPQLVQISAGVPNTPPATTSTTRRRIDDPPRNHLTAAIAQVEPVARLCVGSVGGGTKGDRIRVRVTDDGKGSLVVRALGKHDGTKLGACVERAAQSARVRTTGSRVSIVHTFVL